MDVVLLVLRIFLANGSLSNSCAGDIGLKESLLSPGVKDLSDQDVFASVLVKNRDTVLVMCKCRLLQKVGHARRCL